MNQKELNEIRRRFRLDKNNFSRIFGCYVNSNREVISWIDASLGLMRQEEQEMYLGLLKKSLSGTLGKNLIDVVFSTQQVADSDVLQGGEDPASTDAWVCSVVSAIRERFPDCAVTLSIGEKKKSSYQAYYNAGARRYLLRHETANPEHYRHLHPAELSLENRKRCLYDLKEIGYQVGSGFMVGSPGQTLSHLVEDLQFLQDLQPDMIGIGPYIAQKETPFAGHSNGTLALTLRLVSLLRILFPYALIPATTALGTIHPQGRELGLQAGANVVMPNLSPVRVRKLYALYDDKICTGEESAQCRHCLEQRVASAGYQVVTAIGDVKR